MMNVNYHQQGGNPIVAIHKSQKNLECASGQATYVHKISNQQLIQKQNKKTKRCTSILTMQLIRGALIPNILQISLWSYQGAASFHMRWHNTKLRGMRGYCWGRHLWDSTSAATCKFSLYHTWVLSCRVCIESP